MVASPFPASACTLIYVNHLCVPALINPFKPVPLRLYEEQTGSSIKRFDPVPVRFGCNLLQLISRPETKFMTFAHALKHCVRLLVDRPNSLIKQEFNHCGHR